MAKKIVLYSTPTCPYCEMAKNYLKEKGLEFKEINLASDQEATKKIVRKTGQLGVPVIEIGDKFIVGFDQVKIDQLLR